MGLIAAAVTLLRVGAGSAQPVQAPASVRAHLAVEADVECATADVLAERVRERSQRIELVDAAGDIPRLRVAIGAAGGRDRVAVLSVEWPDGRRSERRIAARSCEAAVDALGLLIAMTLDPAALATAESGPESGSESASESGSESGSESESESGSGSKSESKSESGSESGSGSESQSEPEPGSEPERKSGTGPQGGSTTDRNAAVPPFSLAHAAAGVSAELVAGPAPTAMPGVGAYGRLALNASDPWTLALALRLARTWVDGLSEPGGEASFALENARLAACPLGVQLATFSAFACATGELGRVIASGSLTYSPRTHRDLWTSVGGEALLALGLGAHLELAAGIGVARPLRRDRFAFRPDVFHEVAGAILSGHLGAGVRFP